MFIISETEKELALSVLALKLSSLQMVIRKAIPSQASDEAQGWGGAQTFISLRSKQVWNQHLESSQVKTWSNC